MAGTLVQGPFKTPTYFGTAQVYNTTLAYATADLLAASATSGIIFTNAFAEPNGSGVLKQIHVYSQNSAVTPILYIKLFSEAITAQTDNSPLSLTNAETLAKSRGWIAVAAADYISTTGMSEAVVDVTRLIKATGAQSSLYMMVITNETRTFTAANLVSIGVHIAQDPA